MLQSILTCLSLHSPFCLDSLVFRSKHYTDLRKQKYKQLMIKFHIQFEAKPQCLRQWYDKGGTKQGLPLLLEDHVPSGERQQLSIYFT